MITKIMSKEANDYFSAQLLANGVNFTTTSYVNMLDNFAEIKNKARIDHALNAQAETVKAYEDEIKELNKARVEIEKLKEPNTVKEMLELDFIDNLEPKEINRIFNHFNKQLKEHKEVVKELTWFAHHYSIGVQWQDITMPYKNKLVKLLSKLNKD